MKPPNPATITRMLHLHGFDEFIDNGSTLEDHRQNVNKAEFSWSNMAVLKDDGTLHILGHNSPYYNKVYKEIGSTVVKDVVFVDNNLIYIGDEGDIHMLTDKKKCFRMQIVGKRIEIKHTRQLAATDQDLVILLETKTCFLCRNISNDLDKKIDETMSHLTTTIPLCVSVLSSSIAEVSCGKEHTVLLTTHGAVLTLGGGSRGQLGHGTVDSIKEPKIVDTLAGLKMTTIAAGGWHSLCVSECGDVYCWGWNESGQLGFPSNSVRDKQKSHEIDSKYMCTDRHSNIGTKSDTKIAKSEKGILFTSEEIKSEKAHNATTKDNPIDKYESVLFVQDIDPVQVQSFPCLVDFKDKFNIKSISCGSRHSALLSEDGILLTSGWNDYGQLCQNDKITRDFFETVTSYIKSGTKIKKVFCGSWTTVVLT